VRDTNDTGVADREWFMGIPGDIPLVGDWDGDGVDSFGVYRPSTGQVFLRNAQTTGFADVSYYFGIPGDTPFSGDFDGDGVDTVGLHRETSGLVYLSNGQVTSDAEVEFFFGIPGDIFIGGDWDNDGVDTVGVIRPSTDTFFGRNTNDVGVADFSAPFDASGIPVVTEADIPDIGEVLVGEGSFETLQAAFDVAAPFLGAPPPGAVFTLFAPTDEAFAGLPDGVLDSLLANPPELANILSYHLVPGALTGADLVAEGVVGSLSGTPIFITEGSVIINGSATVVTADLEAADGIVHAVDEVLLPPEADIFLAAEFMRGSTEVPGPGDDDALGVGFISVYDSLFCLEFANTSADTPTVVHIHDGAAGVGGAVVVDFGITPEMWSEDPFSDDKQLFGPICVSADEIAAAAIVATPGDYYLNYHSEEFPAGAVREQLREDTGPPPIAFGAEIALGRNEVPGPGDANGFSEFFILAPTTDNGEWCFQSSTWQIDPITAVHIHTGAAGVDGGVLVNLEAVSRWPVVSLPDGRQVLNGCVAVSGTDQAAIAAAPDGFYVNVHNDTYPAGAVRAQLDAAVLTFLVADLSGDQEVPGPGDPNGFGGTFGVTLDPDEDVIYAVMAVAEIGTPITGFHIHEGDFGVSGPVVVDFDVATTPFVDLGPDFEEFVGGLRYQYEGWIDVDGAVIDAILANPEGYYLNVHNGEFPSGAIRGQLFDPFGPPPS
jgi:hypothetical protein